MMGLGLVLVAAAAATGGTLEVPVEHENPARGRATLRYEMGAPFDPGKPVVLVVADGQQFYVRAGAMPAFQEKVFGGGFNVVGLIGRGATPELIERIAVRDGATDWEAAWSVFRAEQWVEDLELLRRKLVGEQGKVLLYGTSGGGYLVHQYLARHGRHVRRAFTEAPVNPVLAGGLRLSSDRFWDEIGAEQRALVKKALARWPEDRLRLVLTLQRQHYFVTAEALPAERERLIRALAAGDEAAYAKARETYQVEPIVSMLGSPSGIPIRVREFEFLAPTGEAARLDDAEMHPFLEVEASFAAPLLALLRAGRIAMPGWDPGPRHRLETEVAVLAGRWDQAVDYRTAIALAHGYPNHLLFVADDNHQFTAMRAAGADVRLARAFLAHGLRSKEVAEVLLNMEAHRWSER